MGGLDSDEPIAQKKGTVLAGEIIQDSNNYYDIFDEPMYVELSIRVTLF